MLKPLVISTFMILIFMGCGVETSFSSSIPTQSNPTIIRTDPTTVSQGGVLSIFGFGFSIIPAENVISFGGITAPAESYNLTEGTTSGEVEVLTVTVPQDVEAQDYSILVIVNSVASNTDISVTVEP